MKLKLKTSLWGWFLPGKIKKSKKLAEIIVEKFSSIVPNSLEELTSLPGVGRKTANIVLARVHSLPAIGVDTHVHRISNRLGLVKLKPEETEQELNKIKCLIRKNGVLTLF